MMPVKKIKNLGKGLKRDRALIGTLAHWHFGGRYRHKQALLEGRGFDMFDIL